MFSQEGENVAKLEKADILELTVRHLHTLRRQNILGMRSENTYAEKFKAGFRHCAAEVTNFLNVVDQETSTPIIKHLNSCINHMERSTPTNNLHLQHAYGANAINAPINTQLRPSIQIQSPNQINAHAAAAVAAAAVTTHRQSPSSNWSQKGGRSPVPMMPSQPQPKHQIMFSHSANHIYPSRSPNATPDGCAIESSTRVNTPPFSPKIDIDDSSVWRPW